MYLWEGYLKTDTLLYLSAIVFFLVIYSIFIMFTFTLYSNLNRLSKASLTVGGRII